MERNQGSGGKPRSRNIAKGKALSRRRQELQLTQEELARKLKLRTLHLWEEVRAWPDQVVKKEAVWGFTWRMDREPNLASASNFGTKSQIDTKVQDIINVIIQPAS